MILCLCYESVSTCTMISRLEIVKAITSWRAWKWLMQINEAIYLITFLPLLWQYTSKPSVSKTAASLWSQLFAHAGLGIFSCKLAECLPFFMPCLNFRRHVEKISYTVASLPFSAKHETRSFLSVANASRSVFCAVWWCHLKASMWNASPSGPPFSPTTSPKRPWSCPRKK